MMASTIPPHFHHSLQCTIPLSICLEVAAKPRRRKPSLSSCNEFTNGALFHVYNKRSFFNTKPCSTRPVLTRVSSDGGDPVDATPQQESYSEIEGKDGSLSTFSDSYVALFVRMLGLDNDFLDREQAIVALWKYSLGGKKCIDNIMQFQQCLNLIINLLNSKSTLACEAAAGLLRSISSVNVYRDEVAEAGAIEEITALLTQPSLPSEVKEQSICCLWNLSVDEKHRVKIADNDTLPLLIKSLEDEDTRLQEASGGVLSNLVLSHSNHSIMVEAGVIPKLAKFLQNKKESEVIRKEARNTLLELAKNEYYRILVIEEGLIPVPLLGASAYEYFTQNLHSWPTFHDGIEIRNPSDHPSMLGVYQVLLGLSGDVTGNIDKAKKEVMKAQARQHFLARMGAIEAEDEKSSKYESSTNSQFTLLPWLDGVARLVLILHLEDESAISRAAESIASASVNEHMRCSLKEAGAIEALVPRLDHDSDAVRYAVISALERLSISDGVCQIIEATGVISPLSGMLKNSKTSGSLLEKALSLLARILDPSKEMKSKFYDGPVNGFEKGSNTARVSYGDIGLSKVDGISTSKSDARQDILDLAVVSRLVELMKCSSSNLQRIAASVLEFMAIIDSGMDVIVSVNIESGLDAVFQQNMLSEMNFDIENQQPEVYVLQVEEAGLSISAASQLLIKLLESEQFRNSINAGHFTQLLRKILKSNIPLRYKDWVAACLVKLGHLCGRTPVLDFNDPINMEVTLYETIPRLLEQISSSLSPEAQEAAVVELNRIISEGVVDGTQAIASNGGIFPLVKVIEGGSERTAEAALSILYNLSMDNENHSAIVAAGAVPALTRIIRSERSQWRRALQVLRTLPV